MSDAPAVADIMPLPVSVTSLSRLHDWMWREIATREEFAGARADKPLLLDSGGPRPST